MHMAMRLVVCCWAILLLLGDGGSTVHAASTQTSTRPATPRRSPFRSLGLDRWRRNTTNNNATKAEPSVDQEPKETPQHQPNNNNKKNSTKSTTTTTNRRWNLFRNRNSNTTTPVKNETPTTDGAPPDAPPIQPSANQTSATPQQQQQQQPPPQPQQQQVIVLKGAPVVSPTTTTTISPYPTTAFRLGRRVGDDNRVLFVEVLGTVLGTLTRLWLLRYLTSWMAKQEESMIPMQHFVWERLNDRHARDALALQNAVNIPPAGVSSRRWKWVQRFQQGRNPTSKRRQRRSMLAETFTRTVVVVEIMSDSKDGPDVVYLADIVNFLLQQHRNHAFGTHKSGEPMELEVLLLVQSPGGGVATFGLAAAQIQRLSREPGIGTTVSIDKYAASGGYMIASQAKRLIAAPFASVGSVGVILEGLNFHELARRYGIQPLVIKAGNSKNPLTTFGEVSRQDMLHEKARLEKVHEAFQELIVQARPLLREKLHRVADGSVFLGQEALNLGLVDGVLTSSEYILQRMEAGDRVLKLHRANPQRFPRRVLSPLDILPHLQSWVGKLLQSPHTMTWLASAGFVHHLVQQYVEFDTGR